MATNTDLAWCAGFFDGEGHVSYRRQINPKTMRVSGMMMCSIPQNADNKEVLEFFQSTIGFGTICGPYKITVNGKENERYEVRYKTEEIMELLIILKPYLKSKKTLDFQRALAAYWMHDPTATEEDISKMIKRQLKKA